MDSFYQKPVSIMDDLNKCNTSDTHVDEVINKVFYCGLNSAVSLTGVLGNSLLLVIFVHPSLLPHKTLFHSYLKVGHHQSFKRRSIRRFIITEKAHTMAFYTVSRCDTGTPTQLSYKGQVALKTLKLTDQTVPYGLYVCITISRPLTVG